MPKTKRASPLLTVVIPIYDEALSLPFVIPEMLAYCKARDWNAVLVNDGSEDETPKILAEYGAVKGVKIIQHKVNRGYGGAIKTGILAVETPYLVTMDADGQHAIEDVDKLLKFALEKDADMVVGNRGRYWRDWYRTLGKWIIRMFARLMMPLHIYDLNSGFKLYRSDLAKHYLHLCPDSMAFSDIITLVFINQRNLVLEYPITIKERITGKSTISTHTAIDTMAAILNLVMLFNPLKIFLPPSILCIVFGVAWGLPIVLSGRGVSVGSMLAIVIGLLLFFLGLIASQLAAIRAGMLTTTDAEKGPGKDLR